MARTRTRNLDAMLTGLALVVAACASQPGLTPGQDADAAMTATDTADTKETSDAMQLTPAEDGKSGQDAAEIDDASASADSAGATDIKSGDDAADAISASDATETPELPNLPPDADVAEAPDATPDATPDAATDASLDAAAPDSESDAAPDALPDADTIEPAKDTAPDATAADTNPPPSDGGATCIDGLLLPPDASNAYDPQHCQGVACSCPSAPYPEGSPCCPDCVITCDYPTCCVYVNQYHCKYGNWKINTWYNCL